jgi:hypothetical protein
MNRSLAITQTLKEHTLSQHDSSCKPNCNDSHNPFDHSSKDYWGGPDYASEEDRRRYSGCFPASALVETPSGKVPIGNLKKYDLVLSIKDGVLVPRRITHKLAYRAAPVIRVAFCDGGESLTATATHSFLTPTGWRRLDKLMRGDIIIRASAAGSIKAGYIREIGVTDSVEPVFNLYTEREHNFIANGCVAHNFTHLRQLRTFLHNIFFDDVPAGLIHASLNKGQPATESDRHVASLKGATGPFACGPVFSSQ